MKKIKEDQVVQSKKAGLNNKVVADAKAGTGGKKFATFPEEFEEDRSMNIRMKPQPLAHSKKKL